MMKKTVPFVFLAAGIAGFFLRRTEMNTVFDPNTGFAEAGATVSALLTAITVVVLIGAAVFAFAMKAKDKELDKIFALDRAEFIAYTVCGVAQIAAGIMWLLERESVVGFVAGILAAISGVAVVLFALCMGGGRKMEALSTIYAVPTVFFCFWLAVLYKGNSGNPQVIEFSYQALGFAAGAMSMYYAEGFVCGRGKPKRALGVSLAAVYLLCPALATAGGASEAIMLISTAALAMMHGICILRNMTSKEVTE